MPQRGNALAWLPHVKGHLVTTSIQSSNDVLPSQFFRSPSLLQPEKRLMLAVLEEAVQSYVRYAGEPGARARRIFAENAAWFGSDDASSPFSFVNICHALDFEPSYLRAGLCRMRGSDRIGPEAPARPATRAVVRYHPAALGHVSGRVSLHVRHEPG
jgi:hypothetical protein